MPVKFHHQTPISTTLKIKHIDSCAVDDDIEAYNTMVWILILKLFNSDTSNINLPSKSVALVVTGCRGGHLSVICQMLGLLYSIQQNLAI